MAEVYISVVWHQSSLVVIFSVGFLSLVVVMTY